MSSDGPVQAALREAIIVKAGLSVTDAAERLGVGRPALSNLLNGNASLSIPLAIKIERAFGLSGRALLIMQLDHELAAAGGAPPSSGPPVKAKPIAPKPAKKAAASPPKPAPAEAPANPAKLDLPVFGKFTRPIYQKGSKK